MKMLNRIAIVSGVLTLLCAIGAAIIGPMAVGDAIAVARDLDNDYSTITQVLSVPGDGVKSVEITGNFVDSLKVRESEDGQVHIYTDGYRIGGVEFTSKLGPDGVLEIRHMANDPSFIEVFTRENLLRSMAAGMNNVGNRTVELHLPKGVAINLESNRGIIWHRDVAPGIPVLLPPEPEEPEEEIISSEGETLPEEERMEKLQLLEEENRELWGIYQDMRAGDLDGDGAWRQLNPLLRSMAEKLAPLCMDEMNQASQVQVLERLNSYGILQAEYSMLHLERARVAELYEMGAMEKEVYYNRDLALDAQEKALDGQILSEIRQIERALLTVDGELEGTLLFGQVVDDSVLEGYGG